MIEPMSDDAMLQMSKKLRNKPVSNRRIRHLRETNEINVISTGLCSVIRIKLSDFPLGVFWRVDCDAFRRIDQKHNLNVVVFQPNNLS